jgi:hypothetical protein
MGTPVGNKERPIRAIMIIKPVDGGRAAIGVVDCPICGKEHYTTQVRAGNLAVYCGLEYSKEDGWNTLSIESTT